MEFGFRENMRWRCHDPYSIVNQTPKCREHFMYVVLLDVFATLDTGMSVKWWAHEGSQGRRIREDDGGTQSSNFFDGGSK